MDNLTKRLYVGAVIDGSRIKEVELVPSNGVAEKVYTAKYPDSPFKWMADVLTVSIRDIGGEIVAEKARESFKKTGSFSIPECIKKLPHADVNSLLMEIHRTLWLNLIEKQTCICKFCGQTMIVDIDLNKIEMSEEDLASSEIECDSLLYMLKSPLIYHVRGELEKRNFSEYDNRQYNSLEFRIPLLSDMLRHEKSFKDTIIFWRKVALDCLTRIVMLEDGKVTDELPVEVVRPQGLGFFDDYFSGIDLKGIRDVLRNDPPTLPFYYEEKCVNCNRMTPVTVEPSSFFSE